MLTLMWGSCLPSQGVSSYYVLQRLRVREIWRNGEVLFNHKAVGGKVNQYNQYTKCLWVAGLFSTLAPHSQWTHSDKSARVFTMVGLMGKGRNLNRIGLNLVG